MELEVKMLCTSREAVDDATTMLDGAGFHPLVKCGGRAAYDATLVVEVDDRQMAAAPMGGAHILGAVGDAVWCACDGLVSSLHVQERGMLAGWKDGVRQAFKSGTAWCVTPTARYLDLPAK